MNRGNVRVVERREQTRLALEARDPLGHRSKHVRQNFESDVAVEIDIAGAIHLAHAARPEERDDFIWTDAGTGGEGHGCVRPGRELYPARGARVIEQYQTSYRRCIRLPILVGHKDSVKASG